MVVGNDSLAYFAENKKMGVIDLKGKILIEPIYKELQYERDFFIGKDSSNEKIRL